MVAVVAVRRQGLPLIIRQQAISRAVVPAAWPLAKVATHSSYTANLWAGDTLGSLDQGRIMLSHLRILDQLVQGDQGAQAQAGPRLELDSLQFFEFLQVDYTRWTDDPVFHQAEQVSSPCQDRSFTLRFGQQLDGCL